MLSPEWVLQRAAFIAHQYDRNAQGQILYNLTDKFHLCGLIERAASFPKSGSAYRRSADQRVVQEAKALFCRAHKTMHPAAWEWDEKRTCQQVADALNGCVGAEG